MIIYFNNNVANDRVEFAIDPFTQSALVENPDFFKRDALEWLKVSTYAGKPGHALMSFAKTYYENLFDGRADIQVMDALDHITSGQIMDFMVQVQVAKTCDELINAFGYIALAFAHACNMWID